MTDVLEGRVAAPPRSPLDDARAQLADATAVLGYDRTPA
jgi:hypothetical protein